MRRRCHLAVVAVIAAIATTCGGPSSGSDGATSDQLALSNPVEPDTAGSSTGRVTFEGTPPVPTPIRMASDPNCIREGGAAVDDPVRVGAGGGLQNVFVHVSDGLGDLVFPIPSETGPDGERVAVPVVLDQDGCEYIPRVFGIQTGQPLEIVNSDPTLHNVHGMPAMSREFNFGQPVEGIRHTHVFTAPEVMVPFKCDVHNWMRAWAGVVDHPFHAVTGEDGGFTLEGLPPGTYSIEAWHETLGTHAQTVTIGERDSQELAFAFAAD